MGVSPPGGEEPWLLPSPEDAMPLWIALGLKSGLLDVIVNEYSMFFYTKDISFGECLVSYPIVSTA